MDENQCGVIQTDAAYFTLRALLSENGL